MKKAVLTILCILFLNCGCLAADNLSMQITQIEKSYFGYDYPDENNLSRLDRLEKAVYGSVSTRPQTQRVQKLYTDLQTGTLPMSTSNIAQAPQDDIQEELPVADNDVKYPIVDKIEQKVFKKSFSTEDIYKRLSRLEKQVFKKESNASLNERVDNLRNSVLAYDSVRDDSDSIVIEGYDPQNMSYNPDENYDNNRYNYYTPQNTKNRIAVPKQDYSEIGSASQSYDIATLEDSVLGKKFTGESASRRLARLENSVFQRTFSDDEDARIQRLMAATTAQKTAKHYDSNKLMQHLNTGIQIGGIILMVLAMIL